VNTTVKAAVVASLWLVPCVTVLSQRAPSTFQGSWSATAGSAILHGTWSAQTTAAAPDAASGGWLLTNAGGGIVVMEGTWSARKAAGVWRGSWSARAKNGRTFRGSWDTPIADPRVKSFADLLQAAVDGQMSGGWSMGAAAGGWTLKRTPR
jgi:hypothetical protein